MTDHLPAKVDRAAIERIIQRAAELQTGERDIGESMTPDEVLALGKDVGIPEAFLRQAMLEEQGRLVALPPPGFLDKTMGPGVAMAQRVVRGDPEEVERALIAYVDDEELLGIQRRQSGRITWEPFSGVQGAIRWGSAMLRSRHQMLARASTVTATVAGLEPGYSHVAVSADMRSARGAILGGMAAILSVGAAATVVLGALSAFWLVAVAPIPVALGAAWAVTRRFRPLAARAQLGLERALDHLERGAVKPAHALESGRGGVLGSLMEEVRRAIEGPK